jgi:hypothetical protein
MTLSRRFAPLLIAMLLITGALIIGLGRRHFDACREPEALRWLDRVAGTREFEERIETHTRRRSQWTRGTAGTGAYYDPRVRVRVVREFTTLGLWLNPSLVIRENLVPDAEFVEWVETSAGEIPVHVAHKYTESRSRLIAYVYVYGRQPVANPFAAALRDSFSALVRGAQPVTILLVAGSIDHGRLPVLSAASVRWLKAAFEHHQDVCAS